MEKVLNMPYSRFLGIKKSSKKKYLVEMEGGLNFLNHIGVLHASALFSFAEIAGGCFLAQTFPNEERNTIPMLRGARIKFSAQVKGKIFAIVKLVQKKPEEIRETLYSKKSTRFYLDTEVFDQNEVLVFKGKFEWYVKLRQEFINQELDKDLSMN